jgi:hypothetical protein
VFSEVGLVLDTVFYFFLLELLHLLDSETTDTSNVVRVGLLVRVVKVVELVLVKGLLLGFLSGHRIGFKNYKE